MVMVGIIGLGAIPPLATICRFLKIMPFNPEFFVVPWGRDAKNSHGRLCIYIIIGGAQNHRGPQKKSVLNVRFF